ncbi:hypothetical protein DV737_g882, partial [Chaetothyriales sp. CBS 132003]
MFGGKKDKDDPDSSSADGSSSSTTTPASASGNVGNAGNAGNTGGKTEGLSRTDSTSSGRASEPATDRKRKGSTAKAREIFTQAKNSLIHGDKDGPQTPMQKLSRTDPALGVPQGTNNNSAGESHPTANSSFSVGVTEDKNKKCRRTMEDTHSYLYNFLGTPAPVVDSAASASTRTQSLDDKASLTTVPSHNSRRVVETDNGYFAIFDGHAGTFAAEWCGKKLHVILEELMRKNPNMPVPELLDQTYTAADNQLEKLPLKNSGCTAITAVLRWEDRVPASHSATGSQAIAVLAAAASKNAEAAEQAEASHEAGDDSTARTNSTADAAAAAAIQEAKQKATRQRILYTANVGDARIVLCRNGKALRLSYDHKGVDENEGRRIAKAGGLILNNRVNGVLAVTRALGDSYLKDLVTGHPYTTETVIQPDQDEFLILACDGLWDVCSDQEAVDLVRNVHEPQLASKMLVDHALARFSTDNLSVMVVRFDGQMLQHNAMADIGVEHEGAREQGTVSEVEMLVGEARRRSVLTQEGALDSPDETDELPDRAVKDELPDRVVKDELPDGVVKDELPDGVVKDELPGREVAPEGPEKMDGTVAEKHGASESSTDVDESKAVNSGPPASS